MLTFHKTRIIFLLLAVFAIIVLQITGAAWYYFLIIPAWYIAIISYGSASIQAGFFMKSICKADISEKKIALTFDDGPDPIHTPSVLAVLREQKVKATFFVIGKKIEGNEVILKQIVEEGHIIANHSFSHSYLFDFFSTTKVTNDLIAATTKIKEVTGFTSKLFRPPYGVTNPNIAKAVANLKLLSIGWNVRSLDTVIQNPDRLYERVVKKIKPGSIILFHDTGSNTTKTLKEIILFTQKNGYTITGLDELLSIKAYEEI